MSNSISCCINTTKSIVPQDPNIIQNAATRAKLPINDEPYNIVTALIAAPDVIAKRPNTSSIGTITASIINSKTIPFCAHQAKKSSKPTAVNEKP